MRLQLRLDRSLFRGGFLALTLAVGVPELSSENVTLTTFYPAPSGVYTRVISTGDTYLARSGGANAVGIGTSSPGAGIMLDVSGEVRSSGNMTVTTQFDVGNLVIARQSCTLTTWQGTLASTCSTAGQGQYATFIPGVLHTFTPAMMNNNNYAWRDERPKIYCCACPSGAAGLNNCN